jgi:DNA-binding XRE family transcriptional regulator
VTGLYDLRIHLNLTHEQLGEKVEISPDTIRNLENGKRPHTATAHKLTVFFSKELDRIVPASELFSPARPALQAVPDDGGEAA